MYFPSSRMIKKGVIISVIAILLLNLSLIIGAYELTHFKKPGSYVPEENSFFNGFLILDRPMNHTPPVPGDIIKRIKSGQENIDTWYHPIDSSKGIVVLFHGYKGEKTSLEKNAAAFRAMGFSTILVDFRGSGNSDGWSTTIGYQEAQNVVSAYEYAGEFSENVILYGVSMGAASIMRAVAVFDIHPDKIILECPFATMQQTIRNRFVRFHVPVLPLADLMTYWGGKIHGFDAFSHNPVDYAKKINLPVLLMCGDQDKNVRNFETDNIFESLASRNKTLHIFKGADHENYLVRYGDEWNEVVNKFSKNIE